jgi:hypothetical protein
MKHSSRYSSARKPLTEPEDEEMIWFWPFLSKTIGNLYYEPAERTRGAVHRGTTEKGEWICNIFVNYRVVFVKYEIHSSDGREKKDL